MSTILDTYFHYIIDSLLTEGVHNNMEATITVTYDTNYAELVGRLTKDFTYSHSFGSEKFYKAVLAVTRQSGVEDYINLVASEYLISDLGENDVISVTGDFRSYNDSPTGRLDLFIFAYDLYKTSSSPSNSLELEGRLCKDPVYRITPLGREICDVMLAVCRPSGKTDFIPCIAWGRTAVGLSKLKTGDKITIFGRIQSREYTKSTDTGIESRMAYEVSINLIRDIEAS